MLRNLFAYDNTPLREITGRLLRPGGLELTRRGLDVCGFSPGARLLDLGCGAGASLELLRELGFFAMGLDRSMKLLQEAPARTPRLRADFAALPIAPACLDGIVCECVLSLAADPALVLAECARALKVGGRMLLSDIFVRESALDARPCSGQAIFPCTEGARTLPSLMEMFAARGFTVLLAEDHSGLMAELAAQIIWHFGSLEAFARLWSGNGEHCEPAPSGCGGGAKYGYTLIIAQKRSS